mmetsp:Transcript_19241/g.36865  ORF Transcript_19241/g.36865 Transcript_19241/m.36865 type:complete len:276 (-) Transcript_19241:404-1231(-)|eukprot:CAMPEP_0114245458 /NCGR_PEP_ID=MMETSP0058-20121206/11906_1 /TAXON_ID=36894 /ORGANISM="Pyramimonas parkeae, CCMP726" /LENGTH=275 /DNA_ID=CAMNT_0001358511 /DNA_START=26 /DNA_END=853 /DNA_ORIENTATION=+
MDPLTGDDVPSRFALDHEELDDEIRLKDYIVRPPLIQWTKKVKSLFADGRLHTKVFVLATNSAGNMLIHQMLRSKEMAGSVVLPGVSMAGNRLEPGYMDKSCYLYTSGAEDELLFASCQYDVPALQMHAFARALLAQVEFRRIVVLASAPACSSLRSNAAGGLFTLDTDAYRVLSATAPFQPLLPPGSVVDGLAAAVVSYCQLRRLPARLLLSIDQAPLTDMQVVHTTCTALKIELGSMGDVSSVENTFDSSAKPHTLKAIHVEQETSSFASLFS